MEIGGSLLCSQEPTTDYFPEPDNSIPQLLILFLKEPF